MLARLIIQTVAVGVAMAALLFGPAGTADWPGAWVFLCEILGASLATGAWLARHDPALLKERMSGMFQRGQPRADKVLMAIFLVLTIVWLPAMGLDAMRYKLSHVPAWLQAVGAVAVALCFVIALLTFHAN